jgi:hypothetical protein
MNTDSVQPNTERAGMAASVAICLTPGEVAQLTGRTRPFAQRRALRHMAIDHKQRPDGSVIVLRSTLDGVLTIGQAVKRTEPKWG